LSLLITKSSSTIKNGFNSEIDIVFNPTSAPSTISHLFGISIDFNPEEKKACRPISFKHEIPSNITSARDPDQAKQDSPMNSTFDEIIIDFSLEQTPKAFSSIRLRLQSFLNITSLRD
jgi:hypothetical protein